MSSSDPVQFYEDNQSTIKIVSNPKDSSRIKHIDVKYFFVRELVKKGCIKIEYVSSTEQLADTFTKSLPAGLGLTDCSDWAGVLRVQSLRTPLALPLLFIILSTVDLQPTGGRRKNGPGF